jgi:membrane associated rhomboid family serine protease
VVTPALMLLNALLFAYQSALSPDQRELFILRWGAIPLELTEGDLDPTVPFPVAGTLLTALFLHADVPHLASNLFYLGLFGWPLERVVGGRKLLALYLLCGVGAGLAQVAAYPASLVPIVGASGAVAGAMGAYAALFPGPTLRAVLLAGWLTLELIDVLHFPSATAQWVAGPASWAHLAGLGAGVVLALMVRCPVDGREACDRRVREVVGRWPDITLR